MLLLGPASPTPAVPGASAAPSPPPCISASPGTPCCCCEGKDARCVGTTPNAVYCACWYCSNRWGGARMRFCMTLPTCCGITCSPYFLTSSFSAGTYFLAIRCRRSKMCMVRIPSCPASSTASSIWRSRGTSTNKLPLLIASASPSSPSPSPSSAGPVYSFRSLTHVTAFPFISATYTWMLPFFNSLPLILRQYRCPFLPVNPSTILSSDSITALPTVLAMRSLTRRMKRDSSWMVYVAVSASSCWW
mmetsp:Transcript_28470/g.73304  ORF Transcript_28470/g.73304 Transcript_28470/m.73304 type:complete len:247 (-) Transcript_28470:797-1537(-)